MRRNKRRTNFLKKIVIAGALGTSLLSIGELTVGLGSRISGNVLNLIGDSLHSKTKGQFWQAYNDKERMETLFNGDKPKTEEIDHGLLPDPGILEKLPITEDNAIIINSDDGKPIATRNATRKNIRLKNIPEFVADAFVLREDRSFWNHYGINWIGKFRIPLTYISKGRLIGGSGITEQVAKMLSTPRGRINPGRSGIEGILHKGVEVLYATELETLYPKEKILEFYLNNVPFGDRSFGVEAAAETYFNKNVRQLTKAEALFLSILIKNPGKNPKDDDGFKFQLKQYQTFLKALYEDGKITSKEFKEFSRDKTIKIKPWKKEGIGEFNYPSSIRVVSKEFEGQGISLEDYLSLERQENPGFGFTVNTSVNRDITKKLQSSFRYGLKLDSSLAESCGVVLDNDGRIIAIIGRRDTKYWTDRNAAIENRMQIASTIKPILYGINYDLGLFEPSTVLSDDPDDSNYPIVIDSPRNWDGSYGRKMTLKTALTKSNNVITRRVYDKILDRSNFNILLEYLEKLGYDIDEWKVAGSKDRNNNALGSRTATPLQVVGAYQVFNRRDENGRFTGDYVKPTIIDSVKLGNNLIRYTRIPVKVFKPETVRKIRSSLNDVAEKLIGLDLVDKVILKTGTSSETVYAWTSGGLDNYSFAFVVYNPDGRSMGEDLFSFSIMQPVVRSFVNNMLPGLRAITNEPILTNTATNSQDLDSLCETYTNDIIDIKIKNGTLPELQHLSNNLRSCSGIYANKEIDSNNWSRFKFYEGMTEEQLAKISDEINGDYSDVSLEYLRNAQMAYQIVVEGLSDEDKFYDLANTKLSNVKEKIEDRN